MKITNHLANNTEQNKWFCNTSAKLSNNYEKQKTNQKENNNIAINTYEDIDEIIKALQERIEAVKQNEKYDDKTKKYKIEQLQSQIDELNEFKAIKELESVQTQIKERQKKRAEKEKEEEAYTEKNEDGDTYLSEEDAKILVGSQISLDSISYYSRLKSRLESEAGMLKSEMGIDGYSSNFKMKLTNKLARGIARLEMAKSRAMGSINDGARELSKLKAKETENNNISADSEIQGENKEGTEATEAGAAVENTEQQAQSADSR